ncbi:MAG: glycosyltransferase family 4 protein [Euryarchaeota archaeon]|nr:glycosyltransferase family 4 protein [Euryarchaeota archaeon]
MTGRHILMLLSNAYSDDPRVRNEVRSLVDHGHRVTVVAWDRGATAPMEETLDSAHIVRVRHTAWMRSLRLDLLRLHGWWRLAVRTAERIHHADPVDAVHAHDLDTLPAGVRLKRSLGLPLVYDAHEIWGHMLSRDVPWPVPSWFHRKERRLVRAVDRIITVNQVLVDHFTDMGAKAPIVLVQNARKVAVEKYTPPPGPGFTVLYVGRLNAARFILPAIEALSELPRVRLRIGGIGKPDYVARVEAAAARAPNVEFQGRVPNPEVVPMTLAADVVLHMLDPSDRNNRIATGNKLFEAMATGRPIITTEGTSDGETTRREGTGLVVPFDKGALRDAVVRLQGDPDLARDLGRKALEAAKREYNWDVQEERLVAMYRGLLKD